MSVHFVSLRLSSDRFSRLPVVGPQSRLCRGELHEQVDDRRELVQRAPARRRPLDVQLAADRVARARRAPAAAVGRRAAARHWRELRLRLRAARALSLC